VLNFNEKNFISTFFNEGGYVLNFSNSQFDDFTLNSIGIPLQTKYNLSKGKSLSAFINDAEDKEILQLTSDLIEYIEFQHIKNIFTEEKRALYPKLKKLIERYSIKRIFSNSLVTEVDEKFNDLYITNQLEIMMSLIEESPTDVIGKSKELLESCFKHILDELGEEYSTSASVAQLRKQVFSKLNLDPNENISAKNNNDVKRILNSFIQVVEGLNSLRNDKGDGHGKEKGYTELPVRYAKLAMHASLSIVHFTWDTYKINNDKY